MKFTRVTFVLAVTMAAVAHAEEADLNKVVDKAMAGEEVKFIKVDGHEFHVKPITIVRGSKGKAASGLISHHLSKRPDDQIKYRITMKEGEEPRYDITIARGGIEKFLPIPDKWKGKTGKIIDGEWEPSCQRIIDVVAAKLELE